MIYMPARRMHQPVILFNTGGQYDLREKKRTRQQHCPAGGPLVSCGAVRLRNVPSILYVTRQMTDYLLGQADRRSESDRLVDLSSRRRGRAN